MGVLAIGDVRAERPLELLDIELNVAPSGHFATVLVSSRPTGDARLPLPLPSSLRGAELYAQFVWFDGGCARSPFSASGGLAVRVQ